MIEVRDLLMESGLFWCVYQDGRLVEAFTGEGAEDKARRRARSMTKNHKEVAR